MTSAATTRATVLLVSTLLHPAAGCGASEPTLPDAGQAVAVSVPSCVSLGDYRSATFPVRVAFRLDTSCAAINARAHPDRSPSPWLHLIDAADGTPHGNLLSASADPDTGGGPPRRCAEGGGGDEEGLLYPIVSSDLRRRLGDIMSPVPAPAEYDVFVTIGSMESNRARVRIAESCWW